MAIIYSYPLNDDIKPLDELVGTTEKIINGQLKTVTRNFLLQDLAEFFIVDGGLQKTITLTTNDTSGAATLDQITGVLNIPQYSGGGGSPITIVNDNSLFSTGLSGTGSGATNANYSIFLGSQAGYLATYANYSNFLGYQAGYGAGVEEDSGNFNSNFIGYQAGYQAEYARNSNFIGEQVGYQAINATNSNFLGRLTGQDATNAYNSNFFGDAAGKGATRANNSNIFGTSAGIEATDADKSNFIGYLTGYLATNANNSNFFGTKAGQEAINASYSNLFGYYAGSSFTDNNIGSNNIIIGTNISLPDATDNSINLGGVLFGTGTHSDLSGPPSITPISGGKIGIGVVDPTNTLHIYSEAEDTSGLRLERLTSTSPTSTGQAIGVDANGNVVTVTGGGGGSQDLQSVLDNGSTASNVNVGLSSEGGSTLVLTGEGSGLGTFVSYAGQEGGIAIRAINQNETAIRADGCTKLLGGLGLSLYAESIDSSLITDKNVDTANFVNNTILDIDFLYDCSAINVNTINADGIRVYTNSGIGTAINQGLSGKGLVINGGASSVGNPISFNKNGVDKFTVNQAGDVTATKFVKQGGTSSQFLMGDGSVTIGNGGVYSYEIHVSQVDGNDTTGTGAVLNPVASITKALTLITGQRKTIVIHPGNYTESPNITVQYTVLTTYQATGGNTLITGTVSTNTGCSISGLKMTNLTINGVTGRGNINILNCDISGTFTKNGTADYTLIRFCDIGAVNIVSSAGVLAVLGGNLSFITVNSVGASILVKNAVCISPAVLIGSATFADCILISTGPTTNALTTSAGTNIVLANSQCVIPTFQGVARVSLSGFYSILNCVFDKPNSTLVALSGTGGSTNSIVYSQFINADKFIKQGGTSSQILAANGDSITAGTNITISGGTISAIGSGTVTSVAALTLTSTVAADLTSTVENGTTTPVITLNVPDASAAARGVVTTGAQTFAGAKTFTGAISASNLSGTNTGDQDLSGLVVKNTAITGDTKTKITYDSKGLVTSGADITTTDISDFNSASRAQTEATLEEGSNITITPFGTGATRTLTIASPTQQLLPFRMLANNSAVNAVPTVQFFKDIPEQTYILSPTFTPISGPTNIISNTYRYEQVASLVTVRVNLIYTTSASITQVVIPLPADMPTPLAPTGLNGALDILYYGVGMFNTLTTSVATIGRNCFLRRNATTGFEFVIAHSAAVSTRVISLTLQYFME